MRHRLTIFESNDRMSKTVGSSVAIDADESLRRPGTPHTSETKYVKNYAELKEVFEGLTSQQAVTYGVFTEEGCHPIVTKKQYVEVSGKKDNKDLYDDHSFSEFPSVRSAALMRFKGPSVLTIDVDAPDKENTREGKIHPKQGEEHLTKDQVQEILASVAPGLFSGGGLWSPSSSSYVKEKGGEYKTRLKGQRFRFLVEDGENIPEALEALHTRIALSGEYTLKTIKRVNPGLRIDTVVDTALKSPNQLDFAGPAVPIGNYVSCPVPMEILPGDGEAIRLSEAIKPLSKRERSDYRRLRARVNKEFSDTQEYESIRSGQISIQEEKIKEDPLLGEEEKKRRIQEIRSHRLERGLAGYVELTTQDGETVTVEEILADKKRWHGIAVLDPINPKPGEFAAKIYSDQFMPVVNTLKGGGRFYKLLRKTKVLDVAGKGSVFLRREVVESILKDNAAILLRGKLYYVAEGRDKPFTESEAEDYVFDHFTLIDSSGKTTPTDITRRVALGIVHDLTKALESGDNPEGVLIATERPILMEDGSVVREPGLTPCKRYFRRYGVTQTNTDHLDAGDEIKHCIEMIRKPFSQYKYKDAKSKGVAFIAAILAVVRPYIPNAPIIIVNADGAGTGKTAFTDALGRISEGGQGTLLNNTNDEEFIKVLGGFADRTDTTSLVWDNITTEFNSPEKCAVITSRKLDMRRLGRSEIISTNNYFFFMGTGNNFRVSGDMTRRILRVELDRYKNHNQKVFDGKPIDIVEKHRKEIVEAVFRLLEIKDKEMQGEGLESIYRREGASSSFTGFDKHVRGLFLWLKKKGYLEDMKDPISQFTENKYLSEGAQQVLEVLEMLKETYEDQEFTSSEVIALAGFVITGGELSEDRMGLQDTLMDLTGRKKRKEVNSRVVGQWLRSAAKISKENKLPLRLSIRKPSGTNLHSITEITENDLHTGE